MCFCVNVCVCDRTQWQCNIFLDTHTHIFKYMHTHAHHQECRLSKHRNSSRRDMMMSEKSCLATHRMSSDQVCYSRREQKYTPSHRLHSHSGIFKNVELHSSFIHTLLRPTHTRKHESSDECESSLQRGRRDA